MRKLGAFIYGLGVVCALLVLSGGAIGAAVIVAHVAIFGFPG